MRIIQRIKPGAAADYLLAAKKKYPESFNEVWFCTLYGFPPLEKHAKEAEFLKEKAEKFRQAGIRVSMQLSNSVGHGQYASANDSSGLVYEGSCVEKMVGHDGRVADYAFCFWGEHFRSYIERQVRLYVSAVRPAEFWIDDDLRARNHAPVDFGCFCDSCIRRFNKKHGYSFERETLVSEFLHGDVEVRKNYIAFLREGISSLTELICKAASESCEETVVALQNGPNGPYTGYGHDYIFDTIFRTTGKVPMYRPGASAYHDHDPNLLAEKIYELDYQCSMLPSYVKVICPEIENIPYVFSGKSMAGTALEAAMNLANGATDISFAMTGPLPDTLEYYEKGLSLFEKQSGYYKKLSAVSAKTRAGGFSYAVSKEMHVRPLSPQDTLFDFNASAEKVPLDFVKNGLPVTYHDTDLVLLTAEQARRMSVSELRALLSRAVLTDGEAVEVIQKRGIDLGFSIAVPGEFDALYMQEVPLFSSALTDVPPFTANFFAPGDGNHRYLCSLPKGAFALSAYAPSDLLPVLTDEVTYPHGYASALFETPLGGRWAVMGYALWKSSVPAWRRDRILDVADLLSPLPARVLSPIQSYVMCRVDEQGRTAAVSVTNCTVGEEDDIKVLIRNPMAESFRWDSQYNGSCSLAFEKTEKGYIVTIPKLSPWSIGTVFVGDF